jgi:hypothetical protein
LTHEKHTVQNEDCQELSVLADAVHFVRFDIDKTLHGALLLGRGLVENFFAFKAFV